MASPTEAARQLKGSGRIEMKNLTENDDRCGAIADFLVLGSTQLNHAFGSRMRNINLTQDGVTIVCLIGHDAAKELRLP